MLAIDFYRVAYLPPIVRAFAFVGDSGGWIVGSGANYLIGLQDEVPRDYDIMVPMIAWEEATRFIPRDTRANSFGGWRIETAEANLDVWPGELGSYLAQVPTKPTYGVNPKKNVFVSASSSVKRERSTVSRPKPVTHTQLPFQQLLVTPAKEEQVETEKTAADKLDDWAPTHFKVG